MTIDEYKERYIAEIMEQAHIDRKFAEDCFTAIPAEDLAELAAEGDPSAAVSEELSYWND